MSQMKTGDVITLKANDVSIPAYRIAQVAATTGYADLPATITSNLLGITQNNASATGEAVGITINGTSKVTAGASITAGDPVGAQTGGTGKAVTVATTTTAGIGIALVSGSTNSVIEITVQPRRVL